MPRTITSRPPSSNSMSMFEFNETELELIAALMCHVKLGHGEKYKEAAKDIMEKIEDATNPNFSAISCIHVAPHVEILNNAGWSVATISGTQFQIIV